MAVNFVDLKCPNCGGKLNDVEGRNEVFCSYCGSRLVKSDPNHFVVDVNYTHTYREIDEARIKETEAEDKSDRRDTILLIVSLVLLVLLIFGGRILGIWGS